MKATELRLKMPSMKASIGDADLASQPRSWVRHLYGGGVSRECCPSWCSATHANDQGKMLDDLSHSSTAVAMRVATRIEVESDPVAWPVLAASITQWPHAEEAAAREPYVQFEPSPDDVIEMGPARLRVMIDQIRAHADRLEHVHAQLVAARAEHQAAIRA